jgi:preprotein translocase subunit SecA
MKIFSWLTPNREQQAVKKYSKVVATINDLEKKVKNYSEAELKQAATKYRGQEAQDLKRQIPEIFAVVREASRRTLKMRHFDMQLMGGLVLLEGGIAEMKTGEGKTLVATLPLVVRGLTGQGAHLITVNDYLAQRDAKWMQPVYEFFDLSVGIISSGQTPEQKRAAYAADITYGTNNEFGFDYLRDNMAQTPSHLAQRELVYAIVDEVDSILIDEARTPLIISAPDQESTQLYAQFARLVPQLKINVDYNIDEKRRSAILTDDGISRVEQILGINHLYEERGIRFVHHLEQALRAQTLYQRDKDYVVQEGQVVIVDEFTGRLMPGRRYSEGLHQALEAKEGVQVQQESRTLASITFQNFFRLYKTMSGMTGTALTSAEEFEKVYNLEVQVIPTNRPLVRQDRPDRIFINEKAKSQAIVKEIKKRYESRQPVLVGTIAIEKSEKLSEALKQAGVKHEVLNAKHHAREAEIIAQAGQAGAVTISTNMAGRGTDIKLGEGVDKRGGLFVLGTERHEARRIDNQLRGRSGRQGDPGETQFFVSLDDDVMRVFGGERMKGLMKKLRIPEDEPIENRLVSRAIASAQERVEGYYFDMRKQVLSYDDVLNRQRNAIYTLRRSLLIKGTWKEPQQAAENIHQTLLNLLQLQAAELVGAHTAAPVIDDWNIEEIAEVLAALVGGEVTLIQANLNKTVATAKRAGVEEAREGLKQAVHQLTESRLQQRQEELGREALENLERAAAMRAIDTYWMEHLDTMDYLRTGIGLRGYGQRDPLVEYQKEGHRLFQQLMKRIKETLVEVVFKAEAVKQEPLLGQEKKPDQTKVGRNDPCPCGSGKKFKKCHGR